MLLFRAWWPQVDVLKCLMSRHGQDLGMHILSIPAREITGAMRRNGVRTECSEEWTNRPLMALRSVDRFFGNTISRNIEPQEHGAGVESALGRSRAPRS